MALLVHHLIFDTNALIKNAKLETMGEKLYTVAEAIGEVLDKNTRDKLNIMPYDINILSPSQASIKKVVEFSKSSGDYVSLSATDLKILSLAYELHTNYSETDSVPLNSPMKVDYQITTQRKEEKSTPVGFVWPKAVSAEADDVQCEKASVDACVSQEESVLGEEADKDERDEEEAEEGWITEDNISNAFQAMGVHETSASQDRVLVACLTTDYAMQNVLLHMGIKVLSMDGLLIRKLKNYVLRCHGCFNVSKNMDLRFCPKCGNETLDKISITSDPEKGKIYYHLSKRKTPTAKGLRYSLPAPKGGKHAWNPILCADQPVPHNELSKREKEKCDALDPDYIIRTSPFHLHDTTSRSAMLGLKNHSKNKSRSQNASHNKRRR